MKIYQVSATARYSTGMLSRAIHSRLLQEGHESRLAYGNDGEHTEGLYHISNTFIQRLDAKVEQLTGIEGAMTIFNTIRLIRDINRFEPDVIHLHNVHGNYMFAPMFFKFLKKKKLPVVLTLHDCWSMTGGCMHFSRKKCYHWKTTCSECKHMYSCVRNKLSGSPEKKLARKRKWLNDLDKLTVVSVSKWLAQVAKESHLRNREILTIYNGINIDIFKPINVEAFRQREEFSESIILLGVASTWNEGKGFREWKKLATTLGESYKIVLIGVRPDQVTADMPSNVIAMGQIKSPEHLAEYYNLADIFINMSYEETFGLTTAEAISCGTPVIVINSTANPELVTPETGIVVEDRNIDEIKHAIQFMEEVGIDKYRDACVKYAKKNFTIEKMMQEYIKLYRSC